MRGEQEQQQVMMFVVSPEDMIPKDHPIRIIKKLADLELKRRVLAKTAPPGSTAATYRPDDALLSFLNNL